MPVRSWRNIGAADSHQEALIAVALRVGYNFLVDSATYLRVIASALKDFSSRNLAKLAKAYASV